MTLKQIERTREFLHRVQTVQGYLDTKNLVAEMREFYINEFNVELTISGFYAKDCYNAEYNERDKLALIGFLEGYLAKENNADIICGILDLISEGERIKQNENERYNFLISVYSSYYGKIAFDKNMETIATAPLEFLRIRNLSVTEEMISGLIVKLRIYATQLIQDSKNVTTGNNKQEINFQPQINVDAKNETNVNLVAVFDNARQRAEDSGLPDEQYKILLEKISELEELAKRKESKGKRWQKVKDFMQWLVEQGIQVAGILLPVLAHTIQ